MPNEKLQRGGSRFILAEPGLRITAPQSMTDNETNAMLAEYEPLMDQWLETVKQAVLDRFPDLKVEVQM